MTDVVIVGLVASEESGEVVRSAEELIAMGDRHFERVSDGEMDILFQHLHGLSMAHEEYDERDWRELQGQFCHRNIPITAFPNAPRMYPTMNDKELSQLFHRLWNRDRDGGNKMSWKVFLKQLSVRNLHL